MVILDNFLLGVACFWLWLWLVRADDCEWTASKDLTYDLTPLELTKGGQLAYYSVKDSRNADNVSATQFSYMFNICAQMLNPGVCGSKKYEWCPNGTDCTNDSLKPLSGTGYAYQVRNGSICHELSNVDSDHTKFALLDADEPAKGLILIYEDGEWCDEYKKNRELRLHFECENNYYNIPDEEQVEEYHCTYNITIKSVNGCPTQCGVYSNSLCGGNGLCSYDWSNQQAGCFCFWNHGGKACEEVTGTSNCTSTFPTRKKDDCMHSFNAPVTWKSNNGINQMTTVNVTYDYLLFQLQDKSYQVTDVNNTFVYNWNFLGNAPWNNSQVDCEAADNPCDFNTNSNCENVGTNGQTPGAAFQINSETKKCNLLARGQLYEWNLYDPQDPARGVAFTYKDGGYCAAEGINRHFTINFVCPTTNKRYTQPENNLVISSYMKETDSHSCNYSLTLETALACPYQCLSNVSNGSTTSYVVCGGRGVCATDPFAGFVRCLCDSGYEGNWCESKIQPTTTSTAVSSVRSDSHVGLQVAIAVVTILVIIFVAVSLYLYIRNRSLEKFRGQLLEDEADDVVSPPLHTEPKVPDDMSDTDSEAEQEKDEHEDDADDTDGHKDTTKKNKDSTAPTTELATIEQPKETANENLEIKLEGPPTEK